MVVSTIQTTIRLPPVATMTMPPNRMLQSTWRHQGTTKAKLATGDAASSSTSAAGSPVMPVGKL